MKIQENVVLFNKLIIFIYNIFNMKSITLLPDDIIQKIILKYIKSYNVFYYCNISIISHYFYKNFNIFYSTLKFTNFKNNYNKSIYFVKSDKYKIKFAKLYFHKKDNGFNLLYGEENLRLIEYKSFNLAMPYEKDNKHLSNINDYQYAII